MSKQKFFVVLVLLILVAFLSNCALKVYPTFDHTFIKTIAVFEFGNTSRRVDAGKIVADRIEQRLINESGYNVLSRMDIDRIMGEKYLHTVIGTINPSTAQEIGKLLNADAFIVGNIENFEIFQKGKKIHTTIALTFKVIRVTDGRMVWSKTTYGKYSNSIKANESEFELFSKSVDNLQRDIRLLYPHERKKKGLEFLKKSQ